MQSSNSTALFDVKSLSAVSLCKTTAPHHSDRSALPWLVRWSLDIVWSHSGLRYTPKYNRLPLPLWTRIRSTERLWHVHTEASEVSRADEQTCLNAPWVSAEHRCCHSRTLNAHNCVCECNIDALGIFVFLLHKTLSWLQAIRTTKSVPVCILHGSAPINSNLFHHSHSFVIYT